LWNGFFDAAHRIVRGLNQMYGTHADVFETYMRPWDTHVSKRIAGYDVPIAFGAMMHEYENANGYSGIRRKR